DRSGQQCFVILDGAAVVEREGLALRRLGSGTFVGDVSPDGRPLPPGRVTVRLEARSHVLVLDSVRLAAAVDADPVLAAAWRLLVSRTLLMAAREPRMRADRVASTGVNHGGPQCPSPSPTPPASMPVAGLTASAGPIAGPSGPMTWKPGFRPSSAGPASLTGWATCWRRRPPAGRGSRSSRVRRD